MKKRGFVAAFLAVILVLAPLSVYAEQTPLAVTVDGVGIDFSANKPIITEGRILLPLGAFTRLSFITQWHPNVYMGMAMLRSRELQIITIVDNPGIVISNNTAGINRFVITDVPPLLIDGVPMLPLRIIAEAVGFDVNWDCDTRTVILTTN